MVPIFIKQLSFRDSMYYYFSYLFFYTCGSFVNLLIYFYALLNMDIIKWGKTRSIKQNNILVKNYAIDLEIDDHFWEITMTRDALKSEDSNEDSELSIGKEYYCLTKDIII